MDARQDPKPARAAREELDELTLARAQRGDRAAERALVERYQRPVFALISRVLAGRDSAATEDLAQEAFLRVFRALPGFDRQGRAALSTWIFTIATRVTIDHLRRARVRAVTLDEPEPERARGVEVLRAQELGRAVESALAALPDEQRAAFVLRQYHELSYEEVASVLGCEVGTVKSRLSRARGQLREALQEVWNA